MSPPRSIRSILTEFRATWKDWYPAASTRRRVQERVRTFLYHCYQHEWIARVPKLSAIKAKDAPTLPLSEEEYSRLLAQIPVEFKKDEKVRRVHALIQLMRYSGLSIRDAVTLERSEIVKDTTCHRIVTNRQKTGTHVSVPLPPSVATEVLEVLNGNPRYVFWTGNGSEVTAVLNWQFDLRRLFHAAGFPKGHPHQLRDTFAVELLRKGGATRRSLQATRAHKHQNYRAFICALGSGAAGQIGFASDSDVG